MTLKGYKQTEEHKRKKGFKLGNQYCKGYKWTKEQREKLNRKEKNAPNYVDGRWIKQYYCIGCGKEICNQGSERCHSCSNRITMKNNWQNPEFKNMKIRQGKQQWEDGKMEGVFNNRTILIESPSNPEKKIMEMLKKIGIDYTFQFRPEGYGKIYDFHLPKFNLLIEYDSEYWHSLPGMRERDAEKTEYAKNNGYNLLRFNEDNLNSFKHSIIELIKEGEKA